MEKESLSKVFISPSRYVQGRDAIQEINDHMEPLNVSKALVVGGKRGLSVTREKRKKSFAESGMEQVEEQFSGESTWDEVQRLIGIAKENNCDIIIGSGGGKTADTVKMVANELNVPTVIVPTTASTDAPTSRLALKYDEEGVFEEFYFPSRNPDLVLVDTKIIAEAPSRFLAAGMGDALATYFEADACRRSCAENLSGGQQTDASYALAETCYNLLMENGVQAIISCENNLVTPALEKIVEANTLLSGIGFESGGLGAAHSMQDGFTVLEPIHAHVHGEKVAFLTLIQLIMESRPKETLKKVYDFCYKVGLPITLDDLSIGLDVVGEEGIREAVKESCLPGKIMYNHAFPITEEMVYDATITADLMGQKIKNNEPII